MDLSEWIAARTPNHGLRKWERGGDWSFNDEMETIEERLVVRDVEDEIEEYRPYEGALALATDTGSLFAGNGGGWIKLDLSVDDLRASTVSTKSVSTERQIVEEYNRFEDGRFVADRYHSWTERLPEYLNGLPFEPTDKGIVAFGWDDTNPEEYTDVFPKFAQRGLPNGLYCNARRMEDGGTRWGTDPSENDDLAAALEMVTLGHEILNHGAQHRNLDDEANWGEGTDFESREAFLIDEVWRGKRELQEHGFSVHGWLSRAGSDINKGEHDSFKSYLIRSTHLLSADGFGKLDSLARYPKRYAATRIGMDDMTADEIIAEIDEAAKLGLRKEFYGHAAGWEFDGKLETVLDHVQEKRAAGEIDVATPTTARLVAGDLRSVDFCANGDANAYETFDADPLRHSFGNTPVVETSGGSDGEHYWTFGEEVDPTGNGAGYGGWANYGRLGPQLHAVGVEFDARGADGGERIHVRNDIENPDFGSTDAEVVHEVTDTWDTYYATFGYPRREQQNRFVFWTGHAEIHLDNVRYHPA